MMGVEGNDILGGTVVDFFDVRGGSVGLGAFVSAGWQ